MSTSPPPSKSSWDKPGEPPAGRSGPRTPQRGAGCLAGGGIWAGLLLALFVLYEVDARSHVGGLPLFWFIMWFALAVTAYLVAIVVTARRSTRRFGQGMLLGMTVLPLIGVAVVLVQIAFTPD